jgi:hypothetical protein
MKTRLALLLSLLLLPSLTFAADPSRRLLLCDVGGLGTEAEVRPHLDGFGAHLAGKLSWPAGTWELKFAAGLPACLEALQSWRPAYAAVPLEVFLGPGKVQGMQPLVAALVGGQAAGSHRVLVKKGAFKSLAELAGKRVLSPTADPGLQKLLLGPAAATLKLETSPRPLRALRALAAGRDWDAVIVDEAQFRSLPALPFFANLEILLTCPALPHLGLVYLPVAPEAERRLFARTLVELCSDPEGGKLCKAFGLEGFVLPKDADFQSLRQRYEGAPK